MVWGVGRVNAWFRSIGCFKTSYHQQSFLACALSAGDLISTSSYDASPISGHCFVLTTVLSGVAAVAITVRSVSRLILSQQHRYASEVSDKAAKHVYRP